MKRTDFPTQIGLKIDAKGDEVGKLQNYLKRFGYIRPDEEKPFGLQIDLQKATEQPRSKVFDNTTEKALKQFQKFNNLEPTGVLDKRTVNLMLKPRCGLPDLVVPKGKFQDYVYSGSKWTKLGLTYRFENYTPDLIQSEVRRIIQEALAKWASITPLNFAEVSSGGDIRILWGAGSHDAPLCSSDPGYYFDGPSGILAHAYYPEDGRVHFDDDEMWTDNLPPSGIDLATVALHELGHTLGLAHSNDTSAVMYAYYGGIRRNLQPDDISGIQSIYGSNGGKVCPVKEAVSTTAIPTIIASTQFLREFRDEVVLKSMFKAPFEQILDRYYELTPIIYDKMVSSALFRHIVKGVVYPFIVGTKGAASLALASMRKSNPYRLRMRY